MIQLPSPPKLGGPLGKARCAVSISTLSGLQPLLHELTTCLSAPTVVLSAADGQVSPAGAQGMFSADVRLLSRAEVEVAGTALEPISAARFGADRAEFVALLRGLGGRGPDPTVWLRRYRTVRPDGMDESFTIENAGPDEITVGLALLLSADLVDIEAVKGGAPPEPDQPGELTDAGLVFRSREVVATVRAPGARLEVGSPARARWDHTVAARSSVSCAVSITVADHGAAVLAPPRPGAGRPVTPDAVRCTDGRPSGVGTDRPGLTVTADDRRLDRLVSQSLADLTALEMATPSRPTDVFYAAGSPWYLTLFGRDSLWAARMGLPLGTRIAAGTLRTLAARQATATELATGAEPGKILHELRREGRGSIDPMLPPVYFGTVDATLLWIDLLERAWRWGLADGEVAALLPAAERGLRWMAESGDADGDGFLEYADASGRGLSNQGWKDSGDAVRFADGRIAHGPVALAEVQGYAHRAAVAGAELLEAFGRPGAARWRDFAGRLAANFREKFWCADALGPYPALALDGDKRRVDAPASNMGHLLGTGILTAAEAGAVAGRLVTPGLSTGFGLRTMSRTAGGYSPLSYHCGSVWPHDTAIAVAGLAGAGFPDQAGTLVSGLLAASDAFDGRFPELYAGWAAAETGSPVPYPAACRPQAWSAGAALVLVQTLLGLQVDVPAGILTLAPNPAAGALAVKGLSIAGHRLDVRADSTGRLLALHYGGPLRVVVDPAVDARSEWPAHRRPPDDPA